MASSTPKFIQKPYSSRIIFLLIALTLLVFWQVREFQFINYDDNAYIIENPFIKNGLTTHAIKWALTADLTFNSPYADYWQPITFLSRILDVQWFGLNPTGHHEMNLFFHLINVIILFFLFKRLTRAVWKSAILAALFAVHPLQVEAVAWVTSRKDLLSTLFGLLAIGWYARSHEKKANQWYCGGLVILFFLCSLMSKGMFVTFPLLLLLVDVWPLGRKSDKAIYPWLPLIFEKWLLILISLIFFYIPFIGQPEAFVYTSKIAILQKSLHAYAEYLLKFAFPFKLGIYPQVMDPHFSIGSSLIILAALAAVSFSVVRQVKERPYLCFGWFWILITVAPVAGLNMMADRFMYVPLIGFLVIVIWGIDELLEHYEILKVHRMFLALLFILVCAFLSYRQAPYWKDSKTAFQRALDLNERNFVIQNNMGLELLMENRVDEALAHFNRSAEIYPNYALAYNNLGIVYANFKKQTLEGLKYYKKALELGPDVPQTYYNIANVFAEEGNREQAVKFFKAGAAVNPNFQGKVTPTLVMMLLQEQTIKIPDVMKDSIPSESR